MENLHDEIVKGQADEFARIAQVTGQEHLIHKAFDELIEKSKKANIGEIHDWSGKKFRKVADGEWVEVSLHGKTKGEHKEYEKKYSEGSKKLSDEKKEEEAEKYKTASFLHRELAEKLSDKKHSDKDLGIEVDKLELKQLVDKLTPLEKVQILTELGQRIPTGDKYFALDKDKGTARFFSRQREATDAQIEAKIRAKLDAREVKVPEAPADEKKEVESKKIKVEKERTITSKFSENRYIDTFKINGVTVATYERSSDYYHTIKDGTPSRIRDKAGMTNRVSWDISGLKKVLGDKFPEGNFKDTQFGMTSGGPDLKWGYKGPTINTSEVKRIIEDYLSVESKQSAIKNDVTDAFDNFFDRTKDITSLDRGWRHFKDFSKKFTETAEAMGLKNLSETKYLGNTQISVSDDMKNLQIKLNDEAIGKIEDIKKELKQMGLKVKDAKDLGSYTVSGGIYSGSRAKQVNLILGKI